MSFFSSLLPALGALGGSLIMPGVGTAIGGMLGSAIGGSGSSGGSSGGMQAAGNQVSGGLAQMLSSEEVRKYLEGQQKKDQERWQATVDLNHPNQVGMSGQKMTWAQDPATGKWTQTASRGPEDQALHDQFYAAKSGLLGQGLSMAGKLGGGIDWESLGLGKMGQAATGREGTSDKFGSIKDGTSWDMIPYAKNLVTGTGNPLGQANQMAPPAVKTPAPVGAPPMTQDEINQLLLSGTGKGF